MNEWIRQFHRWMAITFTLAVVVNIIVNFVVLTPQQIVLVVGGAPAAWSE